MVEIGKTFVHGACVKWFKLMKPPTGHPDPLQHFPYWMAMICKPFAMSKIKYFDAGETEAARAWRAEAYRKHP